MKDPDAVAPFPFVSLTDFRPKPERLNCFSSTNMAEVFTRRLILKER